jgi:succinate dehydrogenase/fumarate reductase flavoprotein subunit
MELRRFQMNSPTIVVAGAGMAGLVAALQAQEKGAHVILLEKSRHPGGSLALSGGTLWCARTYDDLRRLVPRGHPELGHVLVAEYAAGVHWLQALGASLSPLDSLPDRIVYLMEPGPRHFVDHMVGRFLAQGGTLMTGCAAMSLTLDTAGAVTGLIVREGEGQRKSLSAHAVILATGGFQGNAEMMARYFGRWADRLILRGNQCSTGDGWQMATLAGAGNSRAMSSFYGHLLPAPPAVVPVDDFIAYTQYHSEQGILVNLRGERFADESKGDETNSQAVAHQPEALAFLAFDERVYRTYAVRPAGGGARASDTFYESKALGAPAAVADSLEELARQMQPWGLPAQEFLATAEAYNRAVAENRAAQLPVPRRDKVNPISTPPFYMLGVTPGVTFTLGGLPTNADAQVLDRSGFAIPGLYACGADAGGIHNEQYAGGLCLGLVFGRRAAQHAASLH